ncbi:uncharacterized protein M437DRAFT_83987 [Aureobasidium melanogenum CBS 110374]|uniref:Uncharacterized protein n=1 Tax=Aureobasidium melanogenum (strain CBS 110374) TaxID=1043003 RepID=A0A074VSB2_AURM1|nr:uncharacterized protein M437DRAFT_83987 [Aureobasidium melanogenum CBS 110374]KEQ63620.1 hypothetical protein M437DRAFT_83987 [Aureobasidium melanogenum CBS 110374]
MTIPTSALAQKCFCSVCISVQWPQGVVAFWAQVHPRKRFRRSRPHQVIYPSPNPAIIPRPALSLSRRLNEVVIHTRGTPPINTIPESLVASRQNGLAARVANSAASTRSNQVPFTLGQAHALTPAERSLERVRAGLARYRTSTILTLSGQISRSD